MNAATRSLNLLLVEDNEDDAHLVLRHIYRHGYAAQFLRVDTEAALRAALTSQHWDAILSDFSLPTLNGTKALRITREYLPDVPFILVSGAIGEELAVDVMRLGAQDYVMKSNLARLGAVIDRELEESLIRSERRMNEQLRQESEARFRATFEQVAVGLLHVGADRRVLLANERFCTISGYSSEEVAGRDFKTFFPAESRLLFKEWMHKLATGEQDRWFTEEQLVTRSGELIWVDLTASIARTSTTGDRYLVIAIEDVSERVAAARAVRESENKYRILLEQASDGIVVADESGRVTEVNESMCAILRCRPESVLGTSVRELVDEEDLLREPLRFATLARGEAAVVPRTLRRADGTVVYTEINVKRLPDGRLQSIVRDVSERMVAQERLRLSEERFNLITRATNDAMYDLDISSNKIWWNDNFYSVFGYVDMPEVHEGDWWYGRVHPDDLTRIRGSFEAALASTASVWSDEYRFADTLGLFRHVINRGYIVRDNAGRPTRLLGSLLDVTEQRHWEEALRASEIRFRHIYEANLLGVYFWTLDGGVHTANQKFLDLTGYTQEELDGGLVDWRDISAPECVEADERALQQVLERGSCDIFEHTFLRRDGGRVTVLLGATLLSKDSNQCVAFALDVTDRKHAEETLRTSEERFRALFENATDSIAVVDARGIVTFQSPSVERITGYTPEEIVGQSAFAVVEPSDRKRVTDVFFNSIGTPGAIAQVEYRMVHKNGTIRNVESVGHNLIGQSPVNGAVITTRDVTERKQFESRLEQAQKLSSLGRLSASVAHEFNNVMMGIRTFAEVIERNADTNPLLVRASEAIRKSIDRGRLLTQEILRFAQPGEPMFVTVDTREWLTGMEAELRGVLGPQNTLALHAPEGLAMIADSAQLTQVVLNLTLNARDAMRERPGTVTISVKHPAPGEEFAFGTLEHSEDYVYLAVRDEGSGIDAVTLERIFEPLFTTKRSGTGLGLAITQQIVVRHGGQIFVTSKVGEGTTFHLFLRRDKDGVVQRDAEAERPGTAAAAESLRVLLVEDDALVADGLASLLELDGFAVRVAPTGEACRAALKDEVPDAVIMDVGLPDADGIDLTRELLEIYPEVRVVVATGHGEESRVDDLALPDRVAFLQKPYPIIAVENAIRSLVNGQPVAS